MTKFDKNEKVYIILNIHHNVLIKMEQGIDNRSGEGILSWIDNSKRLKMILGAGFVLNVVLSGLVYKSLQKVEGVLNPNLPIFPNFSETLVLTSETEDYSRSSVASVISLPKSAPTPEIKEQDLMPTVPSKEMVVLTPKTGGQEAETPTVSVADLLPPPGEPLLPQGFGNSLPLNLGEGGRGGPEIKLPENPFLDSETIIRGEAPTVQNGKPQNPSEDPEAEKRVICVGCEDSNQDSSEEPIPVEDEYDINSIF